MPKLIALDDLRDPICNLCRMGDAAEQVCLIGSGARAKIMVVGKMPNSLTYQTQLLKQLEEVGIDDRDVFFTSAIKCRNFERDPTNTDVKKCRVYLDQELERVRPKYVLALGNEALLALTGHSGITKYRGKVIERDGRTIIPTISPSAVKRNPGQLQGFMADLRFFSNTVKGQASKFPDPDVKVIDTRAKLDSLTKILARAKHVVYDVETVGDSEFADDARIVSLALTIVYKGKDGEWRDGTVAIPLWHPESPWRAKWRAVLRFLAPWLERVPMHWGHNTKYDARWMREFGVMMRTDHDSLLMAHTLDENRQKGLKPQAQSRLGVAPWAIDTRSLIETPLQLVLEYNAKDTYYTYHISRLMLAELRELPRQYRLYKNLLMPASEEYVNAERIGVWMDRERLATRTKVAADTRDHIEAQLMKWVPEVEQGADPEDLHGWPTTGKRGKLVEVNFNASNWARWWLFEHLGLPVLARGKEKDDGSKGAPSMAESVIQELQDQTGHPALDLLAERGKWQKYCSSFLGTYEEQLDSSDRIHTTYKLHGAVTGRTSSGKPDEEKITAARGTRRRGVNLQQVPRDPFIRGLFGAAPGYRFVEADFSQVELRVMAFLAREEHMLHLYATGIDLHQATAAQTTGKPLSEVTKEERKKAKPQNFGFLYGMSAAKFVITAWENYGIRFTLEEGEAARQAFFQAYPALPKYYAQQRRMAAKYKRVESPMGRVRHLPDIDSADRSVKSEAERQAINSPTQGLASDMALLSMTIIGQKFREQGIDGHVIGTVHDAVNLEIAEKDLHQALPIVKYTMENLPLASMFGFTMDVPIVADLKVGTHWGDARELTEDEVYDYRG